MIGLVIASFGNNYIICTQDGINLLATFKGKTNKAVVGDKVNIQITAYSEDKPIQASINSIVPRKNLLYRSDNMKSKAFASNIDRVLIIVATEPSFNTMLIDRAIVACAIEQIKFSIILNKCDLLDKLDAVHHKLAIYKNLGYEVIEISSKNQQQVNDLFIPFRESNQTCLLMGQSGMGKSSLINSFLPHAQLHTQEISSKLDSGKHTTTHTKIYPFNHTLNINNHEGYLIDSPGFQLFGLNHLSISQIMHNFAEFKPYIGKCKFHNCIHRYEPNCAILKAVEDKEILGLRMNSYYNLIDENKVKAY